jgi:hypothetical protein
MEPAAPRCDGRLRRFCYGVSAVDCLPPPEASDAIQLAIERLVASGAVSSAMVVTRGASILAAGGEVDETAARIILAMHPSSFEDRVHEGCLQLGPTADDARCARILLVAGRVLLLVVVYANDLDFASPAIRRAIDVLELALATVPPANDGGASGASGAEAALCVPTPRSG